MPLELYMRTMILSVSVLAVGALAGCSSVPKAAQAPESTRRAANDPQHIAMLAATAELERARQELALQRRTSEAQRLMDEARDPTAVRTALGIPVRDLSAARRGANVIYTARFPSGSAKLGLSPQATSVLANAARQAPLVVVRGRTDAAQDSPADARIARARAESARVLLVQLGVPSQRIRTTWQAAGDNVASLDTSDGRSANRRVEIEVYAAEPAQGALEPRATLAQQ
jgi:outer membrane protein OmpA-like peptidoglycan-associated protein